MKGLVDSYLWKVVLLLWIVSSFFVLFLLGRIDWIVHHELYGFGLQFSVVWADPYWVSLRLIYASFCFEWCCFGFGFVEEAWCCFKR